MKRAAEWVTPEEATARCSELAVRIGRADRAGGTRTRAPFEPVTDPYAGDKLTTAAVLADAEMRARSPNPTAATGGCHSWCSDPRETT